MHQQRVSSIPLASEERRVFDISGPENKGKRHRIYRFMLSNSTDDDKFTISNQLCIDICGKYPLSISKYFGNFVLNEIDL